MRATLPLSMEKVHEVAALVSILDKLNSLHDQIRAGPHPPNSKENVVCQKVRRQSLHYYYNVIRSYHTYASLKSTSYKFYHNKH